MKTWNLMIWPFFLIFFILSAGTAQSADIDGSKDHLQIKRYDGSEIVKYDFREYDELIIPLGKAKTSQALEDSMPVDGAITRLTYKIPMGRSPLEVMRNYEAELKADGFQQLFAGSKKALGNSFSEAAGYKEILWSPNIPALIMNDDSQRFLALEKKGARGRLVVMLYAVENRFWAGNLKKEAGIEKGQTLLQVDIVESKPMESKMVVVAAEEMEKEISASGRVALYGIYFDTNKANIKAESSETLAEIAKLLKNNHSLKLLVVGHTDSVGAFDYNMELSKNRAVAVVTELIQNYKIASGRLIPVGVSYACPVTPNTSADNRAKNRRVELVEDSP
jgi:outer membrane protein OmpA-like peptidoglycan-associated protein